MSLHLKFEPTKMRRGKPVPRCQGLVWEGPFYAQCESAARPGDRWSRCGRHAAKSDDGSACPVHDERGRRCTAKRNHATGHVFPVTI